MVGAGVVLFLENVLSAATEQWMLIQGAIFMLFVIFLPGGIAEGLRRVAAWRRRPPAPAPDQAAAQTARRESQRPGHGPDPAPARARSVP
jgi:branched-chain amino acid transport system permease protein